MKKLLRFLQETEAATAVEYAVLLALILLAVINSIGVVGQVTGGMWAGIRDEVAAHGVGAS